MRSLDKSSRRRALATAVALALLPGRAAFAQEATAQQATAQEATAQEPETAADAAAPVSPDPVTLDTIIVTAHKRAEDMRDVPASISVISDAQLEDLHATQLTDFAAYVPGFQVGSGGTPGQTSLSLRGIVPISPGATVGTYLDDTPLGSSSFHARSAEFALDLLPYDVEQIEVLRGPQGTFYGANTIGGLLKYRTRAPDLQNFEIRAGADAFDVADAGDFGWGQRIGVNVPLVDDRLALRASFAHQHTPGYIDNAATGEKDQNEFAQQGARVALLWQASEDVSLQLSGMWQSVDSDDNATAVFDWPSLRPIGDGRSNVNRIAQPFEKALAYYSATLNWALGWADFVSATSYSDTTTRQVQDVTELFGVLFPLFGFPEGLSRFQLDLELEKWTQEFRLTSATGERVEWLVGTFFTHEDSKNFQLASAQSLDGAPIPGLDPLATAALPTTYKEYAVFGNLTYKFSERFDLSLGARWARNEQGFTQISSGAILPTVTVPGESTESVWTYSVAPRFHLSEDAMLYARVASGYRPGGPNVVITGAEPPQVDSDSLVNYELGLKAEFLDRRALVDVALFYIDWDDIQINVSEGGVNFRSNAGTAQSRGVELTTLFRPVAGLQLGVNGAYTDASLTEDAPSVSGLAGDRLPSIPEWSAAFTADYSFPLRGDWAGRIGAGWRYVGERFSALESDPDRVRARAYSALDLNADLSNEHWTFRLFVKNATDKHADLNNGLLTDGFGEPVFVFATPLQPRTVGVAVDVKF